MKSFIILLFTLTLAFHVKASYSINDLLDFLIEHKYYDIILDIKIHFGNDVAIDVCLVLAQSTDCETVVYVYMDPSQTSPSPGGPRTPDDIIDFIEDSYFTSEIQKLLEKANDETDNLILTIISYYDVLKQTMTNEEILGFIKKIIFKKSSKKQ